MLANFEFRPSEGRVTYAEMQELWEESRMASDGPKPALAP